MLQDSDLGALFANADVDGSGSIDYEEFLAATLHVCKLEREEALLNAFKVRGDLGITMA